MMQAIETVYKGYRFRSRLEARWAVFFDTLGISWEYESEGFDLTNRAQDIVKAWDNGHSKHGYISPTWTNTVFDESDVSSIKRFLSVGRIWYLPDFYLPDLRNGKYIEIKPFAGDVMWWGDETTMKAKLMGAYVVHGMPGIGKEYEDDCSYGISGDTVGDVPWFFGHCPICDSFDIGFCAWAERICRCQHYHRKDDMRKTSSMRNAVMAARGARFEHGENPQNNRAKMA